MIPPAKTRHAAHATAKSAGPVSRPGARGASSIATRVWIGAENVVGLRAQQSGRIGRVRENGMRRVALLSAVAAAGLLGWWLLRGDASTPDGDRPAAPAPSVATAAAPPARAPERGSRRAAA